MPITTCVFDAYGTLFDVAAAARQAAGEPDFVAIRDNWPALAENWRQKQLQYTWLRAVTEAHDDFWQVTQDGLTGRWTRRGTGATPHCANACWPSTGSLPATPRCRPCCKSSRAMA